MLSIPEDLRALGVTDIVAIDAEFVPRRGERVTPVCICGKSLVHGKEWQLFNDGNHEPCPFPDNAETLFVSFTAPAEWSFYLAMGWELPVTIIDLYAEMCLKFNGCPGKDGKRIFPSLLMALDHYGLDSISAAEKDEMRDLILRGNYTPEERQEILLYCWTDVIALETLLPAMLPSINTYPELQRGAYTRSVAAPEFNGVPIDVPVYEDLKAKWTDIKVGLAMRVEQKHGYGVYALDAKGRAHWTVKGFESLVCRVGLDKVWPRTPQGRFMVSDQDDGGPENRVFKTMAQRCPYLEPLRVTRKTLTTLRRFDLPIGTDGRCRYDQRPWASSTGRNYPKTTEGYIYGLPKWTRRLIKPEPGRALAYVDLRACEYGIQAGLSRDPRMMESYKSGADVYLRLAELAGAVPADATKATHPRERMLYKVAQLAASYGQTAYGLAKNTGCTIQEAKAVHKNMERVYPRYFAWRERSAIGAECARRMITPLGWSVPITKNTKPNFLLNFPIQGAGADILRAATTMMYDEGIRILAMVHDAVLVEDDNQNIEQSAKMVQDCWRKASKSILRGFELDSDIEIVRYPDTFAPEDTDEFWNFLTELRQGVCVPKNDFQSETGALEGSEEEAVSA